MGEAEQVAAAAAAESTKLLQPLIDRLFAHVRGALWGVVTGLCVAVFGLSAYIWYEHLEDQRAVDSAQDAKAAERDKEIARIWAAHFEAVARFKAEQAAYEARAADKLTERVKFEARSLAIMERLDEDVKALQTRRR